MSPTRTHFLQLCRSVFVLTLVSLAGPSLAWADRGPAVAKTLTIAPVELPSKKDGLRELRYSFGKADTSRSVAEAVEQILSERRFFAAYPEEGGDFQLQLTVRRAKMRQERREGWNSDSSSLELDVDLTWTWLRDGVTISEQEQEASVSAPHDIQAGRMAARQAWQTLLTRELSQAYAIAFDSGSFGDASREWISKSDK